MLHYKCIDWQSITQPFTTMSWKDVFTSRGLGGEDRQREAEHTANCNNRGIQEERGDGWKRKQIKEGRRADVGGKDGRTGWWKDGERGEQTDGMDAHREAITA